MNESEQKAILTLCLMAAFADGANDERERVQIRGIVTSLGGAAVDGMPGLYQDVLMKRASIESAAAALTGAESRQLAYELAVCVCDADGAHNAQEAEFLERLRAALGLDSRPAQAFAASAAEIASAPLEPMPPAVAAVTTASPASVDSAEMDRLVLNSAILNGALELMPQSLSSMAILPLQMRMVYRIGKAHGYELDRGHIKDFAATLGIGLTGQFVEQLGRKLFGGLLGAIGGGVGRGIGSAATGTAVTFATTYALGRVAVRYYAGGRTLGMAELKQVFTSLVEEGKTLFPRHAAEVEQKAQTLDAGKIAELVRGA